MLTDVDNQFAGGLLGSIDLAEQGITRRTARTTFGSEQFHKEHLLPEAPSTDEATCAGSGAMPENKIAVIPTKTGSCPLHRTLPDKTRGGALGYEKAESNSAFPMRFHESAVTFHGESALTIITVDSGESMFKSGLGITLALGSLFGSQLSQAQTPEVGQKAPAFVLSTPDGERVRLSEFAGKTAVVLIVLRGYPGYQCPYCVRQVHDFVENASGFASVGAQVVLVYPGPPAELDLHAREFLAKQNPLPENIHLLVDPDYKFMNRYGLRWDEPHETAYPSTFLIDRHGVVFFRKISSGHGDRTTAAETLMELRRARTKP